MSKEIEINKLKETIAQCNAELTYLKTFHSFKQPYTKKDLYFAICGDVVKIGVSNNPDYRIKSLETGSPLELTLLASIPNKGDKENYCHSKLKHLHLHGEWFRYTEEIDLIIKELKND